MFVRLGEHDLAFGELFNLLAGTVHLPPCESSTRGGFEQRLQPISNVAAFGSLLRPVLPVFHDGRCSVNGGTDLDASGVFLVVVGDSFQSGSFIVFGPGSGVVTRVGSEDEEPASRLF